MMVTQWVRSRSFAEPVMVVGVQMRHRRDGLEPSEIEFAQQLAERSTFSSTGSRSSPRRRRGWPADSGIP